MIITRIRNKRKICPSSVSFWLYAVLTIAPVSSFLPFSQCIGRPDGSAQLSLSSLCMVRNIDLPEALILYGTDIAFEEEEDSITWRYGIETLVEDSQADGAAVVVLVEKPEKDTERIALLGKNHCHVLTQTVKPPNPHDLLTALESVTIQPAAFGGSSGFGQRQHLDPERSPLPVHTVVLSSNLSQTRAARAAGMRVVRMVLSSKAEEEEDDFLSDVVVGSEVDFTVDDIATPGSFWLNPPHCRDDEGNGVDPYRLAKEMSENQDDKDETCSSSAKFVVDTEDDEELRRILADLDPL